MGKILGPMQRAQFVASHNNRKYYENDLELYKKLYPDSNLVKNFETAQEFQKPGFQERMLLEVLKVVCTETVWEYRGKAITKEGKKDLDPEQSKTNALEKLKTMDLGEGFNYNEGKALAKVLGTTLENQQKETVRTALKAFLESQETKQEEGDNSQNNQAPVNNDNNQASTEGTGTNNETTPQAGTTTTTTTNNTEAPQATPTEEQEGPEKKSGDQE